MRICPSPFPSVLVLIFCVPVLAYSPVARAQNALPTPREAPLRPVVDEYFGTKLVDPYRYMENLKDPDVQAWIKAQNDYTRAVLARIPSRAALLARIKALDESEPAEVFDLRRTPTGRIFYQKRLASEEIPRLYMRDGLNGRETLLVDPQKYAASGGPHYSIKYYFVSDDGHYVAYGVSPGGSENAVMHVVDTSTGKETGDTIERAYFSIIPSVWRPDNRTFFYNRLQKLAPNASPLELYENSRVYLHTIGIDPDKDPAIFGSGLSPTVKIEPADIPWIVTIPGVPYAIGAVAHGVKREITAYVAPLAAVDKPDAQWRKICDVDDGVINGAIHGDDFFLLTHKRAPRFKIVRTSLSNPDFAAAELVLPEGQAVITNLAAAKDALYVDELEGGIGRLLRMPFDGKSTPERVQLPFDGSLYLSAYDPRVPGTLLDMTTWTKARQLYDYDPATQKVANTGLQPAGRYDNPQDVQSVEVKVKGLDGTVIPLSIVYQRSLKLDGSNPTLLVGYGAYGITMDPSFDRSSLAWLERGGILAFAHVRGGGEYGEEWHKAGMMQTKPNTISDFIACAHYLIDQKYTSTSRLAGSGTSAGGITIGGAITREPHMFGVALDRVGVSDALRLELTSNGVLNIPEFGTAKTPDGFKGLYAMSAYNHIVDGTPYPAVMLTTGMNDPRVDPWQAAKMAARLQAATSSGKPILLRVEYQAGHGLGSTKTQLDEDLADEQSFLFWQFGVPDFQPHPVPSRPERQPLSRSQTPDP